MMSAGKTGRRPYQLIVASVLLLAAAGQAQEYRPEEFLPLAVGNSWTYRHYYFDRLSQPDKDESEISVVQSATITITHTEQINGSTYYVFSNMPYDFPPVPYFFLAGKKVRFSEDGRLMEWRPEGEVWSFDFGPDVPEWKPWLPLPEAGYRIPPQEGDTLAYRPISYISDKHFRMSFAFLGHLPLVGDFEPVLGPDGNIVELLEDRGASFKWRQGMVRASAGIGFVDIDVPVRITLNTLENVSVHLIEQDETHISGSSWGQLKRFSIAPSTRGKSP
jgi:hypothetical protein